MTILEFSNGFDVLVDSYRRFKDYDDRLILDSIEFNEYEKSLFLTLALEIIIQELYSGKYSTTAFEKNEEARRQLNSLVKQADLNPIESTRLNDKFRHSNFELPSDCWYIIYEHGVWSSDNKCIDNHNADIVPVAHDEYFRTINNPFRGPNKKRILRLDSGHLQVELVSSIDIKKYIIRYISKPQPIVLADLSADGINIDGVDYPLTCQLPESLHNEILNRAVNIALSHRTNNTKEKDNADK